MQPVLEIKNISKKFRIRHEQQPYLSLRDSITGFFKRNIHQPSTINHQPSLEDFWALKNISFDVYPGESIGIIGKNGAGKSTLLKILSKITPPTEGKIISRGRIASLLEVGTGFHPELTGRENIFLNGSILGMKRKEILAKFDEIVDFSGVEKFLDTPLKHYSSGMQLRLAFAVAAFLEPEILLIDEVLAVGDAEFQKKCLGKMEDVNKNGKSILFVSHNMGAVKSLCTKGILLEKGQVCSEDKAEKIIKKYINETIEPMAVYKFPKPGGGYSYGFVKKVSVEDEYGNLQTTIPIGKPWQVRIQYHIAMNVPYFIIGIGITSADNYPIRTVWSKPTDVTPGNYEAVFREEQLFFGSGKYKIIIGLSSREVTFQYIDNVCYVDFENYAEKENYVRTSGVGVILNPMKISIQKIILNA